jgi:hypothetical protein
VLGKQLRGNVDPIPGEHAGPTDETIAIDRSHSVQPQPFFDERGIMELAEWRAPEHATFVLRQRRQRADEALEVSLARTCALVVAHAGDDASTALGQVRRAGQQCSRLVTLARRQDEYERKLLGDSVEIVRQHA